MGTFFNGLKYNLIRTAGANLTMFICYEKLKNLILSHLTSNFLIVPLISSIIS